MSLPQGTRLGSYEILTLIGAGGMGQVYRARDTKLGREVAIKVLPEAFSQDKERLARFEREARLLASLNHPNIATLFDLEESGGTHFLVLEFVDGETLAEQIARGALRLDQALPIFKQIAEALEAAHEKGIIHRDLKPANIKVTPEGKVKVLDFGLAKALAPDSPAPDQSESPTITRDGTVTGVLLGTAPYMSPEQARGKVVDKRTDIWAFGCVLFEALAGKKAFDGETVTDTIASIVKTEPMWEELPATTPLRVRDLLARCLRKDPTRRLREIGSARLDVDDAMAELEGRGPVLPAPPKDSPWRHALPWLVAAALLGGFIVGLTVWGLLQSETTPPAGVKRVAVRLPPTDELYLVAANTSVEISPDGSNIIYWGRRDGNGLLFLRPLDELEATPLRGAEWAFHPFFSPDGRWIGFFDYADNFSLKKVPLAGGPAVLICDVPVRSLGATWGPNDTIFFALRRSGLWSVPGEGGTPQPVATTDPEKNEKDYRWPHILPDGKTILVTEWQSESDGGPRIVAVPVETGEIRTLIEAGTYARYATSGHLIFHRDGTLVAVPFDPSSLDVHGLPVMVLDKVRVGGGGGLVDYAISRDGSLVYVTDNQFPPSALVWVNRDGSSRRILEDKRFYHPRLSPDGNRVLVSIREQEDIGNSWIYDLTRSTLTRITFAGRQDVMENTPAIWTPDGTKVTLGSMREEDSQRQFYLIAADGSGQVERLTSSGGLWRSPDSWSPDGKVLAYTEVTDDGAVDVGLLSLEDEPQSISFLDTSFWESEAVFSPDGQWIAYISDESGRHEVYMQPYPSPGEKVQISNKGGNEPVWARDGQELYYRNDNRMMAVPVQLAPTFTAGQPSLVFERDRAKGVGGILWTNYDVSPDGASFLMIERTTEPPRQINLVLNWFEELKHLVPTEN